MAQLSGSFLAFPVRNLPKALQRDLAANGIPTLEMNSAEQVLNARIVRQESASRLQGLDRRV